MSRTFITGLFSLLFFLLAFPAFAAESNDGVFSANQNYLLRNNPQVSSTIASLRETAPGNSDSAIVYQAKPGIVYTYLRAKPSRYVTFPFINIKKYCQVTFTKEKVPEIVAMTASTAILIGYDQQIFDEARRFADQVHLSHTDHQKPLIRGSVKYNGQLIKLPLNFPSDGNTALYFLGDGITHLSIAGGMWLYGTMKSDWRAQQTGTQLIEAIATTGTVIQILKHSTGRECPGYSDQHGRTSGGKWRFFPNLEDYGKNVPKYDAYPTGHLATAMATVTVIADNYPEKGWIRPVGYSLMALCGYAMVNNGVHWASDYPLGISIGYTMAKLCDARGKTIFLEDQKADLQTKKPFWKKVKPGIAWKGDMLGYQLSMPID